MVISYRVSEIFFKSISLDESQQEGISLAVNPSLDNTVFTYTSEHETLCLTSLKHPESRQQGCRDDKRVQYLTLSLKTASIRGSNKAALISRIRNSAFRFLFMYFLVWGFLKEGGGAHFFLSCLKTQQVPWDFAVIHYGF